MRHCNFDKKETWYKDGYKNLKLKQINILKSNDLLFNEDKWILWIVPELFYDYDAKIKGTILIEKNDGTIFSVPYLQRTPHINKMISQLSMKKGNRRFPGFPLVFDSFDDLIKIKKITINWNIYNPLYLNNNIALEAQAINIIVNYNLDFKKDLLNPESRFFTIYSKDFIYNSIKKMHSNLDIDLCEEYYKEFDIALNINGELEYNLNNSKCIPDIFNIYDIKKNNKIVEYSSLSSYEKERLSKLENIPQNIVLLKEILSIVKIKDVIPWNVFYYEKTDTLTASHMADLLI